MNTVIIPGDNGQLIILLLCLYVVMQTFIDAVSLPEHGCAG